jgi:hypothetical protein
MPANQALPAACPACGVILAKVAQGTPGRAAPPPTHAPTARQDADDDRITLRALLLHVPERVDPLRWWLRVALLAGFAAWGLWLMALDVKTGSIMGSFIHLPLLVFHEAGHVIFMPLGHTLTVLGGMLGQCLMPLIMAGALLLKNRDPFGAALALWLLGVSVMDTAPYMYDALQPQLTLLSGQTGEEGGHDWIELFGSWGLLPRAQAIGLATHKLGALVMLAALGWAGWVLKLQHPRLDARALLDE